MKSYFIALTILLAACGQSSFSGSSAPQTNKNAQEKYDTGSKKDPKEKQDTAGDKKLRNEADAGKMGKSAPGDDGKKKSNVTDTGNGDPKLPGSGSDTMGGSGPIPDTSESGWPFDEEITDIFKLEECKMDILKRTGDSSICIKCFNEYLANGGKITAGACGCAYSSGQPIPVPATPPGGAAPASP